MEKCVSPCDPNPCAEDSNSNEVCVAQDTKKYYCGCADDYFWNGEKCVSPCDPNPCGKDKNSTGECTVSTIDLYDCGCKDGYFFDGEKCVNPCTDVSCGQFEHATGECKGESAFAYSCTCDSGYFWRGKDKGCTATKPYAVNVCTGQNKCYDNEKEITCPAEGEEFFGQDAQFARLGICIPQSYSIDYSIESEPVVVDNNTGMMWQRNIPPVETLYSSQASAYCSNLVYGGYDDWSLPSITAFITITDFGRYNPAIDTKYFPDSGKFWTSSMSSETIGGDPIENHGYYTVYYYNSIFDFTDPFVSSVRTYEYDNYSMISGKDYAYSFNIRCVRGPGIGSSTFISKTFGNNLMWNYSNDTIFVKKAGANHTWQEALKYCSELDYAGFSDWRLPNIRELYLTGHTGVHSSTTRAGAPNSDYSGTASKTTVKNDTFCITNDPCEDGKFWNGEKCAKNPCIGNPCKEIAYSSRECQVVDEETFDCGCDSYYFWNSDQKKCLRSCKGNPCSSYQHSDKKCYEDKEIGFYCGCETPYQWNPDKRKCMMNCDTNPCAEIEHGSHECFEDENEGYKCGCVEGHVWIGNSCREDLCNPNPCEEKPYSNGVCTLKYNSDASNGSYYSCGCIEGYKWQGDNVKDCVPK